MSLVINCPVCGARPIEEFVYGEIPTVPASITDPAAIDVDRGFMRTNVEGAQAERWFHLYGCRRWFTIRRDTRTDEIIAGGAAA
jgi:heterotetrameric sarcosine oxidase delta subunit